MLTINSTENSTENLEKCFCDVAILTLVTKTKCQLNVQNTIDIVELKTIFRVILVPTWYNTNIYLYFKYSTYFNLNLNKCIL